MKHFLYVIALLIALNLSAQTNHMDLMTTMTGEFNGSRMGHSVISLDFNGDGIKDLVVLSRLWNPDGIYDTQFMYGKLYFYMGGTAFDNIPEYTICGTYNRQFSGNLINAGDVNGDGKEDIAMCTSERIIPPGTDEQFSIYIFYGREVPQSTPDYTMNLLHEPIMGVNIYPLGDINHDTYDDISISIRTQSREYRAISVLMGNSFDIIPFIENHINLGRDLVLSKIGDVNNDGIDDCHLFYPTANNASGDPRLTVYYGSDSFPECDSLIICENTNLVTDPLACAVGDVNGDGIDDFASNRSPFAKIWFGSSNLSPVWNVELQPCLTAGFEGLISGDLNNDGFDDIIGSNSTVLIDNGRAGVWMGRAAFNGTLDLTLDSPHISQQFGWSKAAGDFNDDGLCDIAISEIGVEGIPNAPGYVYVYSGNADLADTTVDNEDDTIPNPDMSEYKLDVFPNPFKADATIGFNIDSKGVVQLTVFNIKGQVVRELCNAPFDKGEHHFTWDGRDIEGNDAGNGVYMIRMTTMEKTITRSMMLIQ